MQIDEVNLYHFYTDISDNENIITNISEGYSMVDSQNYDWPKFVYNIDRNQSLEKIEELIYKIEDDKLPPFIITKDEDWQFDIQTILETKGFRKIDIWPIMSFTQFDKIQIQPVVGLETHFVENSKELELWFKIATEVLFPRKKMCFDVLNKKLNEKNYKFLIGYYNNEPVAICMLYLKGEVAGLYWGATIKAVRGKGIARYVILSLLQESHNLGYKIATLQSSRMSHNSYLKMGFQEMGKLYVYWMLNKLNKK